MSALLDLWHSIIGIVTAGDWVALAIMAIAALVAAFTMQNWGSLVTATFWALVLFAVAVYVREVVKAGGKNAGAIAQTDWHNLLGLTIHSLLAYAVAFAIVIGVINALRQVAAR